MGPAADLTVDHMAPAGYAIKCRTAASNALPVRTQVGDFEIIDLLSASDFGFVCVALHKVRGRCVVLSGRLLISAARTIEPQKDKAEQRRGSSAAADCAETT